MATPWVDPVKTREPRELRVFAPPSVFAGAWATVFPRALAEFGRLSSAHNLIVTMKPELSEAPETNGFGGADVNFEAASGSATFTVMGQKRTVNIDGTGLSAHTKHSFWKVEGKPRRIFKAHIFVPSTPLVNVGAAGSQANRRGGEALRRGSRTPARGRARGQGPQPRSGCRHLRPSTRPRARSDASAGPLPPRHSPEDGDGTSAVLDCPNGGVDPAALEVRASRMKFSIDQEDPLEIEAPEPDDFARYWAAD